MIKQAIIKTGLTPPEETDAPANAKSASASSPEQELAGGPVRRLSDSVAEKLARLSPDERKQAQEAVSRHIRDRAGR